MKKLILYHGTSEKNARKIMKEGFIPDKSYNWDVKSKKGFVYLSSAYAPFYAMNHDTDKLALIRVSVSISDCYPEDDFLMRVLGKPVYTQEELNEVNFKMYKYLSKASLKYMGNVSVKPNKVKILGVRYFNGENLIMKCDPVISPENFAILGDYYNNLSHWIYNGNEILNFRSFMFIEGDKNEKAKRN